MVHEILSGMSSNPPSSTLSGVAATPAASRVDPVRTCAAFGDPMLWKVMRMTSDESTLTAADASLVLRRGVDSVMKHLRLLSDLSLIVAKAAGRTISAVLIPERWRPRRGMLEYGSCVFRMRPVMKGWRINPRQKCDRTRSLNCFRKRSGTPEKIEPGPLYCPRTSRD